MLLFDHNGNTLCTCKCMALLNTFIRHPLLHKLVSGYLAVLSLPLITSTQPKSQFKHLGSNTIQTQKDLSAATFQSSSTAISQHESNAAPTSSLCICARSRIPKHTSGIQRASTAEPVGRWRPSLPQSSRRL